jgi:hypothetical protein
MTRGSVRGGAAVAAGGGVDKAVAEDVATTTGAGLVIAAVEVG